MDRVRRRVVVSGLVQGVFFRQTCVQEARAHEVAGWVRNLPDGRVEALFEGPDAAVKVMVDWCRGGPPAARVMAVEEFDEIPSDPRPSSFTIRG